MPRQRTKRFSVLCTGWIGKRIYLDEGMQKYRLLLYRLIATRPPKSTRTCWGRDPVCSTLDGRNGLPIKKKLWLQSRQDTVPSWTYPVPPAHAPRIALHIHFDRDMLSGYAVSCRSTKRIVARTADSATNRDLSRLESQLRSRPTT